MLGHDCTSSPCLPEKRLREELHCIGNIVTARQWRDARGDVVVEVIERTNLRGD
jgi:hypothetical protein